MKNIDKTILLAESFGADTSLFASSYVKAVIASSQYAALTENVKWADQFKLKKSIALVEDYKALNYNISSFKEAVILSSRVNYLYSVSGEDYYLNPLSSYAFKIKTKTLGDLLCLYNGQYVSFNDIINEEGRPLSFKAHAIAAQCESYRQEMIEKINFNYAKMRGNKGARRIVIGQGFRLFFLGLIAIVPFLASIYTFVTSRPLFKDVYASFSSSSLWDWGVMAFVGFSCLLFLSYVLLTALTDKNLASYVYFARFGTRRENKIEKTISASAQHLAEYIYTHAKERRPLADDISDYQVYSTLEGEVKAYKRIYEINDSKGVKAAKGFYKTFLILLLLTLVYCLAVYFISKYR